MAGEVEELPDSLVGSIAQYSAETFFGMMLVFEAWTNTEVENPDRPLPDIVGSFETRWLNAVDIRGRVYAVMRKRGTDQPLMASSVTADITTPELDALRRITLSVAKHLTPGRADLQALSQGLPSSV